jgi:hypothetical protein
MYLSVIIFMLTALCACSYQMAAPVDRVDVSDVKGAH